MGTRSLTHFVDGKTTLVTVYRQMDGYPKGMGLDLANILAPLKMVNGLGLNDTLVANGMGCLAAQVIAKLKDGPGSIYINTPGCKNVGEDYTYTITGELDGPLKIKVCGYKKKLFEGDVAAFKEFCERSDG